MGFAPFSQGAQLLASTPPAGFALQNATPTVLSWTAPNDGANHYVQVVAQKDTTSGETGGAINLSLTTPDGTSGANEQIFAGGQGAGLHQAQGCGVVKAGTTFSVVQSTSLTAGASTMWVTIFGQ